MHDFTASSRSAACEQASAMTARGNWAAKDGGKAEHDSAPGKTRNDSAAGVDINECPSATRVHKLPPPPLNAELQRIRDRCPVLASTGCTQEFCQAGRMQHTDEPRVGENREIGVVQHEATEFLREMWRSGHFQSEEQCEERIRSVMAEIEAGSQHAVPRGGTAACTIGGNWFQEFRELEFGIRRAWLNSRKCIMRPHHEELILCDLRWVKKSVDMANELFKGLIEAYDNGNIKITAFVFPPRSIDSRGPMFWNSSVVQFAGYENEDGSILGDTSSVSLTKDIIALGWEPPVPRTRWDLLPLVVMAENDVPVIAEIPSALRKVVEISHPQYGAEFDKLDLKWFAFPALSRFGFDIGGVQYTAAPFIGFWTDSELGTRNLADSFRYNVLPDVVKAMRATTENVEDIEDLSELHEYETLAWLSRAQTELTYAVTWSFHRARVSIIDSLTVSEKYCRFDDEWKQKHGYRLPADPYWLALPQGSIIPIWHRGGAPNYQPKPLVCKHFQDPAKAWYRQREKSDQKTSIHKLDWFEPAPSDQDIKLEVVLQQQEKKVEDVVLNKLPLLSIQDWPIPVHDSEQSYISIYYCSSGTTAQKLSKQLHRQLKTVLPEMPNAVISASVQQVNNLDVADLAKDKILLFVVSTTGQGDIPPNGLAFAEMCQELAATVDPARRFRFSILGNGDSRYASTYNGAAVKFFEMLCKVGGIPLGSGLVEADTAVSPMPTAALKNWAKSLHADVLGLRDTQETGEVSPRSQLGTAVLPVLRRNPTASTSELILQRVKLLCTEFSQATVVGIQPRLLGRPEVSTCITLDLGAKRWEDMSCIQVLPVNTPQKVDFVLDAFDLDGSQWMEMEDGTSVTGFTYRRFFEEIVDLELPFPNLSWLEDLQAQNSDKAISEVSSAKPAIDVISHLSDSGLLGSSLSKSLTRRICCAIPLLNTRTYSVASANSYDTLHSAKCSTLHKRLDILVKHLSGGRFSDTFIKECALPAALQVRLIDSACGQTLREWTGQVPLLVIATGAGFGPIRSLLQRRIAHCTKTASSESSDSSTSGSRSSEEYGVSVFLGFKASDEGIANDILDEASELGLVSTRAIVTSNEQKRRIQDKFGEPKTAARLTEEILQHNGLIFVCTSPQTAKDVQSALDKMLGGSVRRMLGSRYMEEVF